MAKEHTQHDQHEELTEEELEKANGEELPDREAMMVMKPPLPALDPMPPVYSLDPPVNDV